MNDTAKRTTWDLLELPTWLVVVAVYAAWGALMFSGVGLPWWIFCPVGAVIIAWHGNLQHELLHGHPTRSALFNSVLGWAPLGLWMPYHIYRESHLRHHRVETLTSPDEDPESYYFLEQDWWENLCPVRRWFLRINNTLLGRMTIGPMIILIRFALSEFRLIARGNVSHVPGWVLHIIVAVGMLYALNSYLGIPAWYYVVGVAYPGISLLLVRSFNEHRPSEIPAHRTAIVESGPFWSLLFLNNNLHVCHHDCPGAPWYRLPAIYRADRNRILERNGGFFFRSYGELAWRYLLTPKDAPVYPQG